MKELLISKGWDNALFIDGEEAAENFIRSTQNIPYVGILPQQKINVYSILQRDILVISERTIKYLEQRLAVE